MEKMNSFHYSQTTKKQKNNVYLFNTIQVFKKCLVTLITYKGNDCIQAEYNLTFNKIYFDVIKKGAFSYDRTKIPQRSSY